MNFVSDLVKIEPLFYTRVRYHLTHLSNAVQGWVMPASAINTILEYAHLGYSLMRSVSYQQDQINLVSIYRIEL